MGLVNILSPWTLEFLITFYFNIVDRKSVLKANYIPLNSTQHFRVLRPYLRIGDRYTEIMTMCEH